jgi:hypothetical protein
VIALHSADRNPSPFVPATHAVLTNWEYIDSRQIPSVPPTSFKLTLSPLLIPCSKPARSAEKTFRPRGTRFRSGLRIDAHLTCTLLSLSSGFGGHSRDYVPAATGSSMLIIREGEGGHSAGDDFSDDFIRKKPIGHKQGLPATVKTSYRISAERLDLGPRGWLNDIRSFLCCEGHSPHGAPSWRAERKCWSTKTIPNGFARRSSRSAPRKQV